MFNRAISTEQTNNHQQHQQQAINNGHHNNYPQHRRNSFDTASLHHYYIKEQPVSALECAQELSRGGAVAQLPHLHEDESFYPAAPTIRLQKVLVLTALVFWGAD